MYSANRGSCLDFIYKKICFKSVTDANEAADDKRSIYDKGPYQSMASANILPNATNARHVTTLKIA